MKKLLFFDGFCLAALLSLLFTVGFHIGADKSQSEKIKFEIVISPEKISGEPSDNAITLIDGKYECTVKEFRADKIVILCEGYCYDAGYLLSGAKYVSLNQPIKASQPWGYYDGRIYDLYEVSS